MGILRRQADQRKREVDVVAVDIGFDTFTAHVLFEACRNEGLAVRLLRADDGETGHVAVGDPHRLLVRQSDLETVQAVLARSR